MSQQSGSESVRSYQVADISSLINLDSNKDRNRFYQIAFGSVRECQAILMLSNLQSSSVWEKLDVVAAHLYRLLQNSGG